MQLRLATDLLVHVLKITLAVVSAAENWRVTPAKEMKRENASDRSASLRLELGEATPIFRATQAGYLLMQVSWPGSR